MYLLKLKYLTESYKLVLYVCSLKRILNMKKLLFLFVIFYSSVTLCQNKGKKYSIRTIAFYNLENLFDTINDVTKNDEASPMMELKENRSKVYWDKIDKLGSLFKEKYKRDLIGKDMGQFHSDFEMDGAKDDPKAISSIFLGKKCYCDKLKAHDKNGKVIYGYHFRMKGVPSDCIEHKADEDFKNDLIKFLLNLNIVISSEEKNENKNEELKENKSEKKVGRNEKCPCGSGKKFKHCHGRI